jgi:sarcosine oxidase gamma subunit
MTDKTHQAAALEALEKLEALSPNLPDGWLVLAHLRTRAQVEAAFAQSEATEALTAAVAFHTKIISTFMATTMTKTQAQDLVKVLAGMSPDA